MYRSSGTSSRGNEILEALAGELEKNPGTRITTASLARAVGISEAALYRHFPSKARMFEELIQFAEDSVFGLINRINEEQRGVEARCQRLVQLLLGFASKNPGITRILLGDALVGENQRLRERVSQFYERLDTQVKQVLREGVMRGELAETANTALIANLLLSFIEGRINQFVRSQFQRSPLEGWEQQWIMLAAGAFDTEMEADAL